ncbi:ABC-type bacteriocin/lantibiotic exporter with double-glycine peptidase domain [Clostridium saccharobutylicum]|uniref:cysteine peptidase family C39 domain-containing protein n=1 Tax=Clostridium saccharobutylicum TaxID=169679 RepID=UPI0014945265|nr:cysteine peptidase family C39 domain-containing protein [Clostridium saccharobutylicum]NOV82730.1 ABC-type bacteriocin/lantibiotic exporter with double-glycine peptidase domain [Clostridium saccharobutylicum]
MKVKTKRKVPYIEPLQQTECGVCCIGMILRYYKSYQTMQELREHLDVGRDGSTLLQLKQLMDKLNFDTKVYKSSAEGLKDIKLPAILFWDNNHFVVLEKISEKYAVILDPGYGRRKISFKELKETYSQYALSGQPNEKFMPKKKGKSIWFDFIPIISSKKSLYIKIAIFSIISYFLTLGMPIFIQNLLDSVMLKKDINYVRDSTIFLGLFCVVYVLFNYIKNTNLIKLKVHIDKNVNSTVFGHLLRVPYKFFDIRNKSDVLFSANSCFVIRETFANQMINGLIDCGAVLFISYYMYKQSVLLALIAFLIFGVNLVLVALTQPMMFEFSKYLLSEQSKVQGVQVESIFSILGIKMSAIEDDIFENWSKKYGSYLSKYNTKERVNNYVNTLISFIQVVSPVIILCVSISIYIKGYVTIGQVMAFYSLSSTFFSLAHSVFNTWTSFVNSSVYLERLGDIINTEKEDDSKSLIKKILLVILNWKMFRLHIHLNLRRLLKM